MSRSIYKGPYVESSLIRKINNMKNKNIDFSKTPIVTYSRRSQIIPNFIGKIFDVHNGRRFSRIYINENMLGHKLGEFAPTRIYTKHGDSKKQNKGKIIQSKRKRKKR